MAFINKTQLISYPDSLGGNLAGLRDTIEGYFPDCFPGGFHILPPFPSSGDRGFAPIDYDRIDPPFGSWGDIAALGELGPVMLDLMVNHVSRRSEYFTDFLVKGRASAYADLFINIDEFWPGGIPAEDLDRLFLRRSVPFSEYRLASDERIRVWTTFGHGDPSEQIDLNFRSPAAMDLITDRLVSFLSRGIRMLRLDAVGYIAKRRGTSCFFVEPEIWGLMGRIRGIADGLGIDLLPEVHAPVGVQRSLAEHGYWTYDFILPYLVLEAFLLRRSGNLLRYLRDRPSRLFTMLDCHDGIPVKPDLDGFVDEEDAEKVVDICAARGASFSRIFAASHKSLDGFDVHQIRCTYYSALGRDDDAYVAARALQLFAPGIPQVYYVGLLAGENDTQGALKSGEARDVNRHNYTSEEIDRAAAKDTVQRIVRLIRLRNGCTAFDGIFSVAAPGPSSIQLLWVNGADYASLRIDLESAHALVETRCGDGKIMRWKA